MPTTDYNELLKDLAANQGAMQFPNYQAAPLDTPVPPMPYEGKVSSTIPPLVAAPQADDADNDKDIPGNANIANDPDLMWGQGDGQDDKTANGPAATYVGPENKLSAGVSYGTQFGPPSPLDALIGAKSAQPTPDYLSGLLKNMYGPGLQDSDLKAAQQARDNTNLVANLSKAGATIGGALARINPQTGVQDELIKNSGQGIQDIMDRRAAMNQNFDMGIKLADFKDKAAMNDAASPLSAAARAMLISAVPKYANDPNVANMSYNGITKLQPLIDTQLKAAAAKLEKERFLADKQEKTYNQNEQKTQTMLNQVLGGRGAAGRAEIGGQQIDRIIALSNNKNATPQEFQILANDLDAAIKGGTGTTGGAAKIVPATLESEWAKAKQFLTSNPTNAGLDAFRERFKQIAVQMRQEMQKAKDFHINNTIEANKNSLRPTDYAAFRTRYNLDPTAQGGASAGSPFDASAALAELQKRGGQ